MLWRTNNLEGIWFCCVRPSGGNPYKMVVAHQLLEYDWHSRMGAFQNILTSLPPDAIFLATRHIFNSKKPFGLSDWRFVIRYYKLYSYSHYHYMKATIALIKWESILNKVKSRLETSRSAKGRFQLDSLTCSWKEDPWLIFYRESN